MTHYGSNTAKHSLPLIRPAWTPATIALMILGFIIFWPLGLAMIAYILWGDRLNEFKGEVNRATDSVFASCRKATGRDRSDCNQFGRNMRSSGNEAFDEWRNEELARLNEERKKLDEMRDDFDAHMRELRRARDRQEFDDYMAKRKSDSSSSDKKSDIEVETSKDEPLKGNDIF